MELFKRSAGKKTRGQTMVEFALVLPILLMTMYGIMEFGRLLFIYITTASATREAARYAAAVGISDNGVPFYNDCIGIREAVKRIGVLAGIQDSDIIIKYDNGPGTTTPGDIDECPAPGSGPGLGDRIVINVTGHFEPIIPIVVPISIRDIPSSTARTIIRNVTVGENFVIIPPQGAPPPLPPFVSFYTYYGGIVEESVGTVWVQVVKEDPDPYEHDPISVTINAVDIFEAKPNVDFIWGGPLTLTFDPDDESIEFPVVIVNDNLFESDERIVLYITSAVNANIDAPRLHVITIAADGLDEDIPLVAFAKDESYIAENADFKRIRVELDRVSYAPAWVDFEIYGGTAQEGIHYTVTPIDKRLYFNRLDNENRSVTSYAEILINPINNSLEDGERTVVLKLLDPPASPPPNLIVGEPDLHTLTLIDDEECNISLATPDFSGNTFSVDLINSGINDHLNKIDLTFTHTGSTHSLTSVILDPILIASGTKPSPVSIPSDLFPWSDPVDLSFSATGTPRSLIFEFDDTRVQSIDLSIEFEICPMIKAAYTKP